MVARYCSSVSRAGLSRTSLSFPWSSTRCIPLFPYILQSDRHSTIRLSSKVTSSWSDLVNVPTNLIHVSPLILDINRGCNPRSSLFLSLICFCYKFFCKGFNFSMCLLPSADKSILFDTSEPFFSTSRSEATVKNHQLLYRIHRRNNSILPHRKVCLWDQGPAKFVEIWISSEALHRRMSHFTAISASLGASPQQSKGCGHSSTSTKYSKELREFVRYDISDFFLAFPVILAKTIFATVIIPSRLWYYTTFATLHETFPEWRCAFQEFGAIQL